MSHTPTCPIDRKMISHVSIPRDLQRNLRALVLQCENCIKQIPMRRYDVHVKNCVVGVSVDNWIETLDIQDNVDWRRMVPDPPHECRDQMVEFLRDACCPDLKILLARVSEQSWPFQMCGVGAQIKNFNIYSKLLVRRVPNTLLGIVCERDNVKIFKRLNAAGHVPFLVMFK